MSKTPDAIEDCSRPDSDETYFEDFKPVVKAENIPLVSFHHKTFDALCNALIVFG
jgi:hypothetical protein